MFTLPRSGNPRFVLLCATKIDTGQNCSSEREISQADQPCQALGCQDTYNVLGLDTILEVSI